MKNSALVLVIFLLFGCMASAQSIPPDSLYFGQIRPGSTPRIFAPGIISLPGRVEYGVSISPAGDEMLFAIGNWPNKRTMIMKYENNHWTGPDTVSFSKTRSAEEAIYSPGGQRVYYYAYHPPDPAGGADLCYSIKVGSVWKEPINLGTPLNSVQDEYHPCVVADSSIYFENASGKICYSKFQDGAYTPRIVLPAMFNDAKMAWGNPYVAPDESYFIFNSSRPGGFGGTDLYIAYKKSDGSWTNPKNLGNMINTSTNECGSEITDDNLYMTYVSKNDVYWVSANFIDSLKHTNFLPYVKNVINGQTAYVSQQFSYTIPDSVFIDDDGNNTLHFLAALNNGTPLPQWLSLDSVSGTFSGIPSETDTIMIKVTARDTAGATAFTTMKLTVKPSNSVENEIRTEVRIFPNPTSGRFEILLAPTVTDEVAVTVSTLHGQKIHSEKFRERISVDLGEAPKGIYLLQVRNSQIVQTRKIILEK